MRLLVKVISGGQTGADRAALETAKELGFQTGGFAPRGFLTEAGPDLTLRDFGLVALGSPSYPLRTAANVEAADLTVWLGTTNSPGFRCTQNAARRASKLMLVNPTVDELRTALTTYGVEVLNVAGNRASKNPGAALLVRATLRAALEEKK
jgi:hypothetical protein